MATGFKKATVTSGDVPSTQTNFPAYVDLSRLGITTQAEADSIRCYSNEARTTELAREIVSTSEMWVKVPSLTNTFVLYVSWNGTDSDYAVTDTYGRNAVWSDYKVVYHLDGTTDSTGGGRTLTAYGSPTYVAGKLGNAVDLGTGANKNLSYSDSLGLTHLDAVTMQAWYNMATLPTTGQEQIIISKAAQSGGKYGWYADRFYNPSGTVTQSWIRMDSSASSISYTENETPTTGTWYSHHHVWDGSSTGTAYRSGVNQGTYSSSGQYAASGSCFAIGVWWGSLTSGSWKGKIDEVRVRAGTLSANWITTEYNNQSDESGFWGSWSDVSTYNPAFARRRLLIK